MILRSPSGDLEAEFLPERGMVGSSLRHRGQELLGREHGIGDAVLRDAMFGIPFLHPWANRLTADRYTFAGREGRVPRRSAFVPRDDRGRAIHGLIEPVGTWDVRASAGRLRADMDFGSDPDRAAAFPFPHRMTLDVSLSGAALSIRASLTATADVPVPVAFGFHPYLRLPGGGRSRWRLTVPGLRHVETSPDGIPTGRTATEPGRTITLGAHALDDGYVDVPDGAEFSVADGDRRLTVRFDAGYPAAQVYAPAGDDVICVEPMTAPVNALVGGARLRSVGLGETYSATFSLIVEDA